MIEELVIEKFKQIKYLELKNLSKINIFVGNNGCGKTTLLDYIYKDNYKNAYNYECFMETYYDKHKNETIKLLNIFYPYIKDIKNNSIDNKMYLVTDDFNKIYINDMGTGFLEIFCFIIENIFCNKYKNSVVTIDNFGNNLDFLSLSKLIKLMRECTKKNNTQFFISTNNIEMISALINIYDNKDDTTNRFVNYYYLSNDNSNHSVFKYDIDTLLKKTRFPS